MVVLVVEDNRALAANIIEFLEAHGFECDYADNGVLGLSLAMNQSFNAIILDIMLPGKDGMSVCTELRSAGINTPILMLTARDTLEDKLPQTKVLLLAIFPRGATKDDPLRKINDDINNIIKNYDDGERIHYLNINHIFLGENNTLSKSVMKDLLHPNKDQYKVWADALEPNIIALMQ